MEWVNEDFSERYSVSENNGQIRLTIRGVQKSDERSYTFTNGDDRAVFQLEVSGKQCDLILIDK